MSTIRDPAVITNAGRQMMTVGGDIAYTKATLYGQDISHLTKDQLESLTSIGNPLLTVPVGISDKNNAGANTTVVLEATFQNTDLKADLQYTAVGFFAKRGDDAEKLVILGVANSGAYLAAASSDGVATDALDIKVAIAIGDATNVTAVVDPAGAVTPATLNGAINKATHDLTTKIDTKADKTDVTAQFATKADKTTVEQELAVKANSADVDKELTTKANASDVYTKSQTDGKLGQKITFVKCDSPQAAYDASTKPAADGSIVFGIYDMNDEPNEAYVAGQELLKANCEIGNRNYLLNSRDFSSNWFIGQTVSIESQTFLGGNIAKINSGGDGEDNLRQALTDRVPGILTWSVWAKADNSGDILHTELFGGGGRTEQTFSQEWKKYVFNGTLDPNDSRYNIYFWGPSTNKGSIYIALPSLKSGMTVTDWTPAPEDFQAQIDDLKSHLEK